MITAGCDIPGLNNRQTPAPPGHYITAGYLGAQHNPLSTVERVLFSALLVSVLCVGIFVVYASLGTVKTEEE
jgi:cell division protein FtsL